MADETRKTLLEELKILVREMDGDYPVMSHDGLFALMIHHAPVGMLLVDGNGQIAIANHQAAETFGWKSVDLVGQDIEELVPSALRQDHVGWRNEAIREMAQRYLRTVDGQKKNGEVFKVEVGLQTVQIGKGTRYVIAALALLKGGDCVS